MKDLLKGNYPYSRVIRQIKDKKQIPLLFDQPQKEIGGVTPRYIGFIAGLPAKIVYTDDCIYYVSTKKPEHLSKVYNALIDRLLGVHPKVPRSLAEIVGIKQ